MLLLLAACGLPPNLPVSISLNGNWEGGSLPGGSFKKEGASFSRTLVIPEDWGTSPYTTLKLDAAGWLVVASIDGKEAARATGGLWPVSLDLGGKLGPGTHSLTLSFAAPSPDNILKGVKAEPLASWTFNIPKRGEFFARGGLTLNLGPISGARAWLEGDTLMASADLKEGSASFKILQNGQPIAELPVATAKDGLAVSSIPWEGPRWKIGEPVLLELVVESQSQQFLTRLGPRSISTEGRLKLNDQPTYLVGWRPNLSEGSDRNLVSSWAITTARMGANAIELHGAALSQGILDAADELGLPVVVVPRCEGQSRLEGREIPDIRREQWWEEQHPKIAAAAGGHPSVILWSIEDDTLQLPPARYQPYRRYGQPVLTSPQAVGMEERHLGDYLAAAHLPAFFNELPWDFAPNEHGTLEQRLKLLLQAHVSTGIGMIVPSVELNREYAPEYRAALPSVLKEVGIVPYQIPETTSPATLEVQLVDSKGQPVVGRFIRISRSGFPDTGGFTDQKGILTMLLPAGAITLSLPELSRAVELKPGVYTPRWQQALTRVKLELP